MNKIQFLTVLLTLLLASAVMAAPVTVTDSTGQTLILKASPTRIISLSPHATELMFAAGGGDRLVATSSFSDYPERAKTLPVVGSYNLINMEAIVAFKPDLVLVWPSGNPRDITERLNRFGIPVYHSELHTIEDIAAALRIFGKLADSEKGAQAAEQLLQGWQALARQYTGKAKVATFLEVSDNPLMTLNGEHMVSQLFKVCGAENIFADAPVLVPRISREEVVARQPALIVEGGHGDRVGSDALYREWKAFHTIPAVRNKTIYSLDGSLLVRPTPRMLEGAKKFCEKTDLVRALMR